MVPINKGHKPFLTTMVHDKGQGEGWESLQGTRQGAWIHKHQRMSGRDRQAAWLDPHPPLPPELVADRAGPGGTEKGQELPRILSM